MPLPEWMARWNRHVTNPLSLPLASRLRGFGVLHHTGRVSGKSYRTPLNVFESGDGYLVALTYGEGTDWMANARSGAVLETRGLEIAVGPPMLVGLDEGLGRVPAVVRPLLRRISPGGFAEFRQVSQPS